MAAIPDIPEYTAPLLKALAENAGISGLALLITAVYETHLGNLSLFHAIYIIHILFFTGLMVAPAGHYKHNNNRSRVIVSGLITYGCYLMFTVYALYVWGKGTLFQDAGSFTCDNPSNEDIKEVNGQIEYIFFFRPVPVSETWLRVLWMIALGISLAALVFFPVIGCICLFRRGTIGRTWATQPTRNSLFFGAFWVGKILTVVYGVATLEIYEKTNLNSGVLQPGYEDAWSFGQVFAFVQLVSTLNEAFHCCISMFSEEHHGHDSDGEDHESVATHGRLSTTSSRITNLVRLLRPGETDADRPAINEGETTELIEAIRVDIKNPVSPASPVQPLFHDQTQGAMVFA